MLEDEKILFDGDTKLGHYQVIDMNYLGRAARVLMSGYRAAAQSAIPRDNSTRMLFDYNVRFLELISSLKPKNILLIGGGAFVLPMEVLKTFANIKIDVVEINPDLKTLAEKYFGLKTDPRLKIIIGDGREYLQYTTKTYDLILIDAFENTAIPRPLSTQEFAVLVGQKLEKNGVVASNVISAYHGPNNTVIKQQFATYKSIFKHVDIFPADKVITLWVSQNFILTASNKFRRPNYNMSFESLLPPITAQEDIQTDK
jgi:spermidine synthase